MSRVSWRKEQRAYLVILERSRGVIHGIWIGGRLATRPLSPLAEHDRLLVRQFNMIERIKQRASELRARSVRRLPSVATTHRPATPRGL